MSSIEILTTDRLFAQPLGDQDFADLSLMHQDPRVMKTLAPANHPNGGMLSDEETRQFLARDAAHWERYGYGLWSFRDKADQRFVGRCGLRHVRINDGDEVELAYALVAEAWGKGLASEMAEAVVRVGFEQLGLATIACFTLTTNLASQRVMQKAGFHYERDFTKAGLPHVFYRRTNERTKNQEPRTKNQEPGTRTKTPRGYQEPRTIEQ